MIILNPYKENQVVSHNAIHEKPLPPIVYTNRQLRDGICWGMCITLCEAIKIHATNSVCQSNKFHKTVTLNAKISLTVTAIKSETELDKLSDIFFQPVKAKFKLISEQRVKSWRFWFGKHGTCAHKCPLDREFPLPITHLNGGKPLRTWKGETA